MPRNANGIYTLPPLNPVVPFTVIATQWANTTLPDIADALTKSISTEGTSNVSANLPMGGFRHTNVGQALTATQYARADQVQGFVFNVATNVASDATGTLYTGLVPFGVGSTVSIPVMMPMLFVPDKNNGGPSTLALNGGAAVPIINSDLTALSAGQIKANRPYALCFLGGNWILVTNTLDIGTLNTQYVRLAGSSMTGPLILNANPSDGLGAATKNYVDAAVVGSIGGVASFNTRVGAVSLLSLDVTTALGYTPANKAGETFTGGISVQGGVTGQGFLADRYKSQAGTTAGSGTIALLPVTGRTAYYVPMSGNITFTIEAGMIGANILRLVLVNTHTGVVTWPATVVWPLPLTAPPDLAAGTLKRAIVSFTWDGVSHLANVSVF